MKDVTTGTDIRPPRLTRPSLLTIDLEQELEALRAEPAWAEHARTAKTLTKTPSFRLVLTLLRAGGSIGDDDVWSPLTVHVLEGGVTATQGHAAMRVGLGGLAWFDAGPGWRVTAETDAALLLSVTWPPERSVEPAFI